MNVCALDVVARAADFETVAATIEMRSWEWVFLHDIDGKTSLGEIARNRGVDLESAVGLIQEAMHRGLVVIPTQTLEAYRAHAPEAETSHGASSSRFLGAAAVAEPPYEFTPAPAAGAISFSSDAFDWNAPEPTFEESEEHGAAAEVPLSEDKLGSVHYDERFGVEHPGGPFAATSQPEEPFSIASHHEDEPPVASVASVAQHEAPIADPAPQPVDDPFAVAMHHDEPFAEAAPHEIEDPFAVAPSTNGKAHTNGFSTNGHTPVRFDDLFADAAPLAPAPAHEEPVAEVPESESPLLAPSTDAPIRFDVASFDDVPPEPIAETHEPVIEAPAAAAHAAVDAPEEEAQDATAGSISFSFSADEPAGSHETYDAPALRESREIWTPPPVQPTPAPAPAAVAAATPAPAEPANQTQSLYYERESINTPDASRDLDDKVKNWKDSLSWREQQALSEANGTGAEKSGVIGSLLRALGVR